MTLRPAIRSRRLPAIACCLLILVGVRTVAAQELRIFTRVYNDSVFVPGDDAPDGTDKVIARSVSLFHAGLVYDYIDTAGEVIVFDPAHQRFTILSTSRTLATIVEFEQLRQLLKVSRNEAEKYIEQLESRTDRESSRAVSALKFQLDPQFAESYDPKSRRLALESPQLKYVVRCAEPKSAEIVETYLRYADGMARLNHVLHPHAFFPESRLAVNDALRKRKLLPTEVQLQADLEAPLRLRAEHQVHWELDSRDRSLIHHWETLLKQPGTRWVTFREYQRIVLSATATTAASR